MKTNVTAAEIAQYTATVQKIGKKWTHQLIDENGEVIATRKTDKPTPYSAACIIVSTRNSRIASYKRDIKKNRFYKQFVSSIKEDIAQLEAEIADGKDANEYYGREVTWTRGTGSANLGGFVARLVPATVI
jgi:hypothetical protein